MKSVKCDRRALETKNLTARSFENSRWNVAAGTERWQTEQTAHCEASQSTSKDGQKRSTILSMVAVFIWVYTTMFF